MLYGTYAECYFNYAPIGFLSDESMDYVHSAIRVNHLI